MASWQLTALKRWTYTDYVALDGDQRYEVIEGELLMAPAPDVQHQDVLGDFWIALRQYVKEKNLGRVYFAPIDVILGEENVVQPDILFIAGERLGIVHRRGIMGRPDLAVEILSSSSFYRDRYEKRILYERFGIPEYWIVDPANRTIEVFVLEEGEYRLFSCVSEKGTVTSNVIEGFAVELSEIMREEYEA
jgi:Uma2 family endonuclease